MRLRALRGRRAATCRRAAPAAPPRRPARRAARGARRTARPRGSRGSAAPPTDGGFVSRPTVSPRSRGSGTGAPASTDQASATSSTVRAIGPDGVEAWGTSGNTPSAGMRPQLGFRPTSPQQAAGSRIEQPVSVARPRSQRPAASAAAFPPDEPPVVLPGCAGFCTVPYHGFWLVTPQANSCRFAFPTITAPASTRRSYRRRGARRHVVGVDLRAVGRADPGGVDQVLDEQPLPVQRALAAPAAARPR